MSFEMQKLAHDIVTGSVTGTLSVDLQKFSALYRQIENAAHEHDKRVEETHILLLSESALIRFSTAPKFILRVSPGCQLKEVDFSMVLRPKFEGNINPVPLRGFLWTEIKINWYILIPVFVIFLFLLGRDTDFSALQTINQMLVEANALFIGIFVLFTISQNRELLASPELVKEGITHRLMQNDAYIARLSILSLILAFLSAALGGAALRSATLTIPITGWIVNTGNWARWLTSISLVLLIDCLLAVSRYYLRVMRTALEARMYKDLMGSQSENDTDNGES